MVALQGYHVCAPVYGRTSCSAAALGVGQALLQFFACSRIVARITIVRCPWGRTGIVPHTVCTIVVLYMACSSSGARHILLTFSLYPSLQLV